MGVDALHGHFDLFNEVISLLTHSHLEQGVQGNFLIGQFFHGVDFEEINDASESGLMGNDKQIVGRQ